MEGAAHADTRFAAAVRLHRSGDQSGAERLCHEILGDRPDHAEALHLLAVVEMLSGRVEVAAGHLERAIGVGPGDAQLHLNLALALHALGRRAEAEAACRRAIAFKPDYAEAYGELGVVLRESGRVQEAIAALSRAVELRPAYGAALNNLGGALAAVGRLPEAIAAFERATAAQPAFAEAFNNLGVVLRKAGRIEAAARAYRRAIELKPDHVLAQNNLGNVLVQLGAVDEAIGAFEGAIALRPDFAEALSNLGHALRLAGRGAEAIQTCRRALALRPDLPEGLNNLAAALRSVGRPDEAVPLLRRALALKPDFVEGCVNLATALQELGNTDECLDLVDRALAADPDSASAWSLRSDLKTFAPGDPDLQRMESSLASADARGAGVEDRVNLALALGKAWMDAGDGDRSFARLEAGNRIKRAAFAYDVAADVRQGRAIADAFTPGLMAALKGSGDPSELPVFVVGMPRSGTTLIEQILAAHPEVHGAGELTALEDTLVAAARRGLIGPSFPEMASALTADALAWLGRAYVERVAALARDKRRVVDKMPGNFRLAGLIRLMLPNARIIHCRRDPLDTCLSCYSKNFAKGQHFTFELRELGLYYRAYEALMAHWRVVLAPERFAEAAYEAVVEDLEGEARRLVAFLGLAWDPACLAFYAASRPVRTASVNQVRRPIYRTSLGRWKPYAPHLEPLLEALAPSVSPRSGERADPSHP